MDYAIHFSAHSHGYSSGVILGKDELEHEIKVEILEDDNPDQLRLRLVDSNHSSMTIAIRKDFAKELVEAIVQAAQDKEARNDDLE